MRDMELRVKEDGSLDAEAISRARLQADLTQVELAALVGVAPRTVQYWEAGMMPRPKHRRALKQLLPALTDQNPQPLPQ